MGVDTSIYSGLLGPQRSALDYAQQMGQIGLLQMQPEMLRAQVADQQSQAAMRSAQVQDMQRRMAQRQQLFGLLGLGGDSQQSSEPPPPSPASTALGQGAQAGSVGPTPANAQRMDTLPRPQPVQAPGTSAGLLGGVDKNAALFDLLQNDGKNLPGWINDRTKPNIDFVGNVAIDKNRVQPGFSVPTVSQNGQASQTIMDPSAPGGFRVIAPQGALDTFNAYEESKARNAAKFDLQKVIDQNGVERFVPKSSLLPQTQPQSSTTIPPQVQSARNTDQLGILQAELARTTDPADKEALTREISRLTRTGSPTGIPGNAASAPGLGNQASPSPDQAAASAAKKTYADTAAKNAAEYENGINEKVVAGRELVRRVNEQEQLLDQFKTGITGPNRARFALIARDLGAPENVVRGIAGGDPAAAQEFTKFAAQTNLEQLKQAIGANRLLKTEFDAFQEANPSIASDPAAIRKVFQWLRDTYSRDYEQQQSLAQFKKNGGNVADFPSYYSQQQHEKVMQRPGHSNPTDIASLAAAELKKRQSQGGATGSY